MAEAPPAAPPTPKPDHEPSLFVAYGAIITMAVIPIYIGSYVALYRKHAPREADEPKDEVMSAKDAYMFPVMGSAVLFSLYMLFKFLNKDLVNMLLTAYFLFFGFFALVQTVSPLFRKFIPALKSGQRKFEFKIPFTSEVNKMDVDNADIVSMVLAVITLAWYVSSKSWLANNVLGLCFSVQGISMISLGSVQIGAILLTGLFFYDIWWVFFTEVMVTVAKSFDAPIKLLFPKNILTGDVFQYSMLGLGDIVIPGIFIALLLRYDAHRAHGKKGKNNQVLNPHVDSDQFRRPYFHSNLIAYTIGLFTTIAIMHWFKAAQPALLYLVPACLGAALFTALKEGDFSNLIAYQEADDDEKKDDKKEEKKTQ